MYEYNENDIRNNGIHTFDDAEQEELYYKMLHTLFYSCYQKAILSGDTEKMLGLENCFVYMAREAVFECMVYI